MKISKSSMYQCSYVKKIHRWSVGAPHKCSMMQKGFPFITSTGNGFRYFRHNYYDVVMGAMASQITSFMSVCPTVYSGTNERKHQSSESLAFVRGIHRWPVNSPHKGSVTQKMFPFDDVIMILLCFLQCRSLCEPRWPAAGQLHVSRRLLHNRAL